MEPVGRRQALDLEHHVANGHLRLRKEVLDVAPDHQAGDLGQRRRLRIDLGHDLAVAHHRHDIADPLDLGEVMGNVEDGQPARFQRRDGAEQAVHLDLGEGGRRLVEDDHARVRQQRPRDLHELLLGRGQVADQGAARQRDTEEALQRLTAPRLERRPPDAEARNARFSSEKQGLADGRGRYEQAVLVNEGDAGLGSLGGRDLGQGLAEQRDGARVGLDQPGQDLDQRRLAGAVLAHETVNRSLGDRQRGAVERQGGAEPFGERAQGEGRHRIRPALGSVSRGRRVEDFHADEILCRQTWPSCFCTSPALALLAMMAGMKVWDGRLVSPLR